MAMQVYEAGTNPCLFDTQKVLKGEVRPPFPTMLDNTRWSAWKKCPRYFLKNHLLHRVESADNIHLVAGGSFAAGNDAFRRTYYDEDSEYKGDREESLINACFAAIKHYGYDEVREKDPEWAMNAKSCARILMALDSYWKTHNPKIDKIKQVILDGKAASETSITFPLDVCHPVTGEPIIWHGRFDAIVEYMGSLMALDDKTATSLGASWPKQWPMRGQFMGYAYGARRLGYDIAGTIVRGTAILKTSINHMSVPVRHTPGILNKWYDQVNTDVEQMIEDWKAGKWNYNMADGCASYGSCTFLDSCLSNFEYMPLELLPIRVWTPEDPEASRTYDLARIQTIRREHGYYKEENVPD